MSWNNKEDIYRYLKKITNASSIELCFSVQRHHMFIILHTLLLALQRIQLVTMATHQPRNEQARLILMRICKLTVAVKLSL